MLLDITLKITPQKADEAWENTHKSLVGHVGTHFDVMDREFPLEYTRRKGIAFNVSSVGERDIEARDIALEKVERDMFVAFYTGFIEAVGYGNKTYFSQHPQLSVELIEALVEKGVSIIGVDFAGIRRTPEHVPIDRYCAGRGTFVVENLCELKTLTDEKPFIAHTYPMNYTGVTGLPCRVIAER